MKKIVVIGSSGSIGDAFCSCLSSTFPQAVINSFSRKNINTNLPNVRNNLIDYYSENSLKISADKSSSKSDIDLVIICNGILHSEDFMPEKSISQLSFENFNRTILINTILPAMIGKYFIPKLNKNSKSVFAVLSARVGSISDNRIGGWYSYRSSKAALNMIIKNFSIEVKRRNKNAIIVGLHPGTVNSNLSKPFQGNVEKNKLFEPTFSAGKLVGVIQNLSGVDSGKCIAWDGKEIES